MSNIVYGISLIPQTLVDGLWGLYHAFRSILSAVGEGGRYTAHAVKEAPLQVVNIYFLPKVWIF